MGDLCVMHNVLRCSGEPCPDCEYDKKREERVRADERAKVEAEIVAWLRTFEDDDPAHNVAEMIEKSEHRGR